MMTLREHLDAAWNELDDCARIGAIDRASDHILAAINIVDHAIDAEVKAFVDEKICPACGGKLFHKRGCREGWRPDLRVAP